MTAILLTIFALAALAFACSVLNYLRAACASDGDEFVLRMTGAGSYFILGLLFLALDFIFLIVFAIIDGLQQ